MKTDILTNRTFKTAVDQAWFLAREKGVTAVPTFMIGQDKLVGAQPYSTIAKFLIAHGAGKDKTSIRSGITPVPT